MAVILIPATCQLKVTGTVGGNPWNVILHFQQAAGDPVRSATQLNAMAQAMFAGVSSAWVGQWPSSVTLLSVNAVDLSVNAPATGISSGASVSGGATGQQDAASSFMLNFHTAERYRGGHGRAYFPGLGPSFQLNANQWGAAQTSGGAASFQTAVTNTNTAATSNGSSASSLVVPYFTYTYLDDPSRHRYTREKVGWKSNGVVYQITASQKIRTQRRRLG